MPTPPPVETKLLTLPRAVLIANRMLMRRSPIPALTYLLLEPEGEGRIRVTSADLETRLTVHSAGELSKPVLVYGKLLGRFLREVPDATLMPIRGHGVRAAGGGYSIEIHGIDPKDYLPAPERPPEERISRVPFDAEAFAWCTSSAARDDSRPVLTGVAINRATGAMAASDGFRLKIAGDSWDASQLKTSIVVPSGIARFLPADCTEIEVWSSVTTTTTDNAPAVTKETPTRALFCGSNYELNTYLIQGSFPDFGKLLPDKEAWWVELSAAEFRRAVDLVSELGREGSGIVRIETETVEGIQKLKVSARAEEIGLAEAQLDARITGDPRIALNGLYLQDMLRGHGEDLRIGSMGPSSQCTFETNPGRIEVIMPMFVQW